MSVIYIKDLVAEGKHGYHPHEKTKSQRFSISVELEVDTAKAQLSDKLEDTVNWSWARDTIVNAVENNSFDLIERLAQEIAGRLLDDKRIQKVIVSVDKLDAFKSGVPGVRLQASN